MKRIWFLDKINYNFVEYYGDLDSLYILRTGRTVFFYGICSNLVINMVRK